MSLAIRFDHLLRDGIVADQAVLARLGHVTPSRRSQVMALLQLAPEIQGQDQDGRQFKLTDYRSKVVLLYFWQEH